MRGSAALSSFARPRLPPQVPGVPLLGNLPSLVRHPLDFLEQARQRHGDIFRLRLGPREAIALCHPRHAQHVLVDHGRNYTKGGPFWDSVRTFMGNGLPVSEGDYWRRQRRMLQPAFHHQRIATLAARLVETVDETLSEHWEQAARTGEPFNAAQAFAHMTMHLLVRIMFGGGLSQAEAEEAEQAMAYIIHFMVKGMATHALPSWVPVPGRARYRAAIRTMDSILFRMLERGEHEDGLGDTLLSLMSQATDAETGERMTTQQIRDEAVALFVAGFETTSVALAWALHAMTQQPEFGQRLQDEVDGVLGPRVPEFGDLRQLSYTLCMLQETIRLYAPAYWLPRTPEEDDEIDGYRIPAGTLVGVMSHLIHRHPDVWEAPEHFDPERFRPERSEGRPRQAWLGFGGGQRQCIGKEFALMEGQLILARIAQRFRVSAVPGRVAQVQFTTTLRARNGVWVRLSRR
ncbi:cytochrome P450 [Hyalangium versicolor]|uniref:cytochrome P450 n=1 Tax=Hyalangium versicolor TaxID=2861190 RepID=UPI001CCC2432|nr:cytochrome P450 [Hyalangium versicolor]